MDTLIASANPITCMHTIGSDMQKAECCAKTRRVIHSGANQDLIPISKGSRSTTMLTLYPR